MSSGPSSDQLLHGQLTRPCRRLRFNPNLVRARASGHYEHDGDFCVWNECNTLAGNNVGRISVSYTARAKFTLFIWTGVVCVCVTDSAHVPSQPYLRPALPLMGRSVYVMIVRACAAELVKLTFPLGGRHAYTKTRSL